MLFVWDNSAILIILICHWQLLSLRCQIRRGRVTAKQVCLCFTKLKRCAILEALKVVVLWNLWMSSKKKQKSCPFFLSKPRPKKGKKAFSCEASVDLASSNKVFSTKMNGYKKSKIMNANRIRVKSSRILPASLLTWTEFRDKDVSFIV